jgi:FkbM family methyltransferase
MNESYKPLQAQQVLPYVNFAPEWFIDCGPGAGREAHVFKQAFPNIKVIGFEPAAHLYVLNDYPGELVRAAVWFRNGEMAIANHYLQSSLLDFRNAWPTANVVTVTLDAVCGPGVLGRNVRNAVLWMDIEHAELFALVGAIDLLESGAIRLLTVEVRHGTDLIFDGFLGPLGFEKVLDYDNEQTHWDRVYRLKGSAHGVAAELDSTGRSASKRL